MPIDIIAVSGTPGTGKTVYAKRLAFRKRYLYFDVHKFIIQKGIAEGFDRRRQSYIVDAENLCNAIIRALEGVRAKGVVVDSHLSHHLSSNRVSKCFITKCSLKTLQKRLSSRIYGKAKIRENLDAEIFDVCYVEAKEMGHKVRIVWTDR